MYEVFFLKQGGVNKNIRKTGLVVDKPAFKSASLHACWKYQVIRSVL